MESIITAKKQAQLLSRDKNIKLKEAFELIAKENNFSSWKDFKNSLDTFWYEKSSPFLNHWFSVHKEAQEFKDSHGGYLLTYKGQYFVASVDYIEYLGVDPNADIWDKINFDVSSSSSFEKMSEYLKKRKSD